MAGRGARLGRHHELPASRSLSSWLAGPNFLPEDEMNDNDKRCVHGQRTLREGIGRNGKPYRGFFCPSRTCLPEWEAPTKVETPEAVAYSAAIKAAKAACTEAIAEARRVRNLAISEAKAVFALAPGNTDKAPF